MNKPRPEMDGVDHINIHEKARTDLGKNLNNLSNIEFEIEGIGRFRSLESYYWWLVSRDDHFRCLDGHHARKDGKRWENSPEHVSGRYINALGDAACKRVIQNPKLKEALIASTLPFECYTYYGFSSTKVRRAKGYQNHTAILQVLRDRLRAQH